MAKPSDAESGWLRVSTPYSGDGKGHLFTPEKGSQVLVGYEHGRPDAPLVLGNLFHPQNPQQLKYTTAAHHPAKRHPGGGHKPTLRSVTPELRGSGSRLPKARCYFF